MAAVFNGVKNSSSLVATNVCIEALRMSTMLYQPDKKLPEATRSIKKNSHSMHAHMHKHTQRHAHFSDM